MPRVFFFFFFNDTATTEIYTLSLHDALPISARRNVAIKNSRCRAQLCIFNSAHAITIVTDDAIRMKVLIMRSEEHTSELQSQSNLVCRLLLEKKKNLQ